MNHECEEVLYRAPCEATGNPLILSCAGRVASCIAHADRTRRGLPNAAAPVCQLVPDAQPE